MKTLRNIGSLAFVLGLFTTIFAGIPWHVIASTDPVVPWWLRVAVFLLLGGILLVLITVACEQTKNKPTTQSLPPAAEPDTTIMLANTEQIPNRQITENLGLVQGHTVFAIWLGKDLSALVRLILGGELTEYTDMMGKARTAATNRMIQQAEKLNADAIINLRYMTTSVIGSAAELLAYGTAVKLANKNT